MIPKQLVNLVGNDVIDDRKDVSVDISGDATGLRSPVSHGARSRPNRLGWACRFDWQPA
jgi:hypothetical protein